jgi:hypothetical protein
MGKMASRWSKNTSSDFNIDQSVTQCYGLFAPKLISRQGTRVREAKSFNPATGLEPDSSYSLHFSHLHCDGSLWLVGECDGWTRPSKASAQVSCAGRADAVILEESCKRLVASNGQCPPVVLVSRWDDQLCRALSEWANFREEWHTISPMHAPQPSLTVPIFSTWLHDVSSWSLIRQRAV